MVLETLVDSRPVTTRLRSLVRLGLVLLLFGKLNAAPAQALVDRVAAVVNNEIVTLSDLRWLISYKGFPEPEDGEKRRALYESVLGQLIDQKLIAAEALQTPGIQISDEQVRERLDEYKARFEAEAEFQAHLQKIQMTEEELSELVYRQLAVLMFVKVRFEPFVIILPDQIERYYRQTLVPELQQSGQEAPPVSLFDEQIRQILTVTRVNQEVDIWVESARRKAEVIILLFDKEAVSSNLPGELRKELKLEPVAVPDSKPPVKPGGGNS